jgi:hypothetical protein
VKFISEYNVHVHTFVLFLQQKIAVLYFLAASRKGGPLINGEGPPIEAQSLGGSVFMSDVATVMHISSGLPTARGAIPESGTPQLQRLERKIFKKNFCIEI